MPLKKKEEVCGKPNQYNLQTLEYDWKELPDTHFQLPQQQPRVRNYSVAPASPSAAPAAAAAGGRPRDQQRYNPITHEPLNSPAVGPSFTPLPSPSRPTQEDVNRGQQARYENYNEGNQNNNNRRDNVAELFAGQPDPSPAYREQPRRSPTPQQQQPQQMPVASPVAPAVYPYDFGDVAAVQAPSRSPPPQLNPVSVGQAAASPAYRGDVVATIPWSHEDIRRVVTSNALEAQRSYLR